VVRGGAFCDGPSYGYRAEVQLGRSGGGDRDGGGARGARQEYTPQFDQNYRYEGEFRRGEIIVVPEIRFRENGIMRPWLPPVAGAARLPQTALVTRRQAGQSRIRKLSRARPS
jgi:hypothetical protein